MNENTKEWIALIAVCVIFIGFFAGTIWQYVESKKFVVIEDEVINVDLSAEMYMRVTFAGGESYNIRYEYYNPEIDFTVNSKMKIRLAYASSWLSPNFDNVWDIVQIVKIPS